MFMRPGQRDLCPDIGCDKRSTGAQITWVQHREGVWVVGPTSAQNRIIYNTLRGGRSNLTGSFPGRGLPRGLWRGLGASLALLHTLERFGLSFGRFWFLWLGGVYATPDTGSILSHPEPGSPDEAGLRILHHVFGP